MQKQKLFFKTGVPSIFENIHGINVQLRLCFSKVVGPKALAQVCSIKIHRKTPLPESLYSKIDSDTSAFL